MRSICFMSFATILAVLPVQSVAADAVFISTDPISLGLDTYNVRLADIDNDGRPDLASVANLTDAVSVMVNLGPDDDERVNFEQLAVLRTGMAPRDVGVGDFNGDGYPDLAVTNFDDDSISIFHNDGSGGFIESTALNTRAEPDRIEAGDLDGNGLADLVVLERDATSIGIFLAQSGGFASRVGKATSGNLEAIALTDLENDGDIDLLVGGNRLHVLINDGRGAFSEIQEIDLGPRILDLAAGDLDNDGRSDVVASLNGSSSVRILTNRGASRPFSDADPEDSDHVDEKYAGTVPLRLKLSDVTSDGLVDLVLVDGTNPGFIALEGTGYGKFLDPEQFGSSDGITATRLDTGDVDGDGRVDVLVASSSSAQVFRGLNELDYDRFDTYSLGVTPVQVVAARLDADGFDDAVVRDSSQAILYLLRSDGDQELVLSGSLSLVSPAASVSATDLNNDGLDDVIVRETGSDAIDIYRAVGSANFIHETSIPATGRAGAVVTGQFDSNPGTDMAIADITNERVLVYSGNGIDLWQPIADIPFSAQPLLLAPGDLDADGIDELAVFTDDGLPTFHVLRIGEIVETVVTLEAESEISAMRFEDLDNDGDVDLTALSESSSLFHAYRNDGGVFSEARQYATDLGPIGFHLDDVNEDGLLDVVVLAAYDKRVGILYRAGDSYEPYGNFLSMPASPTAGSLADLNDDGRRELVLALPSISSIAIVGRSENERPEARDLHFWLDDDEDFIETFLSATDLNNDDLQYSIVDLPKHGTVTLIDPRNGFFRYDIGEGFDERDTFTYRVNDGIEASEIAVVSIEQEDDDGGGSIGFLWLMLGVLSVFRVKRARSGS